MLLLFVRSQYLQLWQLFKIRQLGNGRTYDNLLKAKAKASVAEDTSDLAFDLDGKKIPKKKKYIYNTNETQSALSESSSDSDEIATSVQFPALQTKTNVCKNTEPSTSKNKNSTTIIKKIETTIDKPTKSNNVKNILPEDTIKTVQTYSN